MVHRKKSGWLGVALVAGLVAWGAAVSLLAAGGAFKATGSLPPVNILLAAVTPPLLFFIAFRVSKGIRQWVESVDLALVTAMQGWRVVGAAFLFYWGYGLLPAAFAAPAGIGDVLVGLLAPFVALKVVRKSPGWMRASYFLVILGMADFISAFTLGVALRDKGQAGYSFAEHTGLLAEFPLTLIPSFLVPFFMILHLIALLRLRHSSLEATGSPIPAEDRRSV